VVNYPCGNLGKAFAGMHALEIYRCRNGIRSQTLPVLLRHTMGKPASALRTFQASQAGLSGTLPTEF